MDKGIVNFYGYRVEHISYVRMKKYNSEEELLDLFPEFMVNLIFNELDPQKCNMVIGVRIGYQNEKTPFKSEVILRGFYDIDEKVSNKEDLIKLFLVNGSAILFPYLRSTLTDITSKSDHDPIILPTFNFNTIINDINPDDIIADSSEYEELDYGHR